jgi:cellulose synthase/poly-beta-1,6-N-acetylglucosamine synthase-like glycosyltransferase
LSLWEQLLLLGAFTFALSFQKTICMSVLINVIFILYAAALVAITAYCLMQLNLLYKYRQHHRRLRRQKNGTSKVGAGIEHRPDRDWPFVTIQLPIFNEMYVVERLIDNIMQLDYPRDRFEVHVLDDSTDETVDITRRKVEEYRAKGFNIAQYHRTNRQGYKAGALKEAMQHARGEFVAIFDADFLPRPDFLKATLAHFEDEKVGVVQTRWEHLNENYSLITRLQALQLNVHFRVEQKGRHAGNYLLQFNGTAGVWRRHTIDDAGGWEADTLTEDLDLSIRAQLKGWKIIFLEEVGSPAELPAEMHGLKSQQFRWMKGGAETARKMLPTVWRSDLSFGQKIHATMQLVASTVFVCVFIMGVFSVPILLYWSNVQLGSTLLEYCYVGMLALIAVHYTANVEMQQESGAYWKRLAKFILLFPLFLALSMGLSLHNTVAVVQGWLGKKSAFVRTPKFNITGLKDNLWNRKYLSKRISWTTAMEGLLAVFFAYAAWSGYQSGNYGFLAMHLSMALGYSFIFYYSLRHVRIRR